MSISTHTVAGLVGLLLAGSAQAASVSLVTDPDSAVIGIGETIDLSIVSSSDYGNFTGVNIDVTYDADVLRYETATFSPVLDFLQMPQQHPTGASGPGTTVRNITAATFFGAGSGEEVLATLSFSAIGAGTSEVAITGTGGQLVVGQDGPHNTLLTADVQVVPLPGSVLLLGSALAGLAAVRRRTAKT